MKIINIMASSLDGKIASGANESDQDRLAMGFTCAEDHEILTSYIEEADAIILGSKSAAQSNGIIPIKNQKKNAYPTWIILSNKGIAANHELFNTPHIPKIIVSKEQIPLSLDPPINTSFWIYENEHPASYIISQLKSMKMSQILLFGGGAINALFYEKSLVNELILTVCPIIVGNCLAPTLINPTLSHPIKLELNSSQICKNHVSLKYTVKI